jgi:PTH1 family peptidyl-tRNA hydrolase
VKLVVGLGNPGSKYSETRHNVGFMALEMYADRATATLKEGHKGLWAKARGKGGHDVLLLKPMTFMNLSGESVQSLAAFFKVKPEDILVLQDELEFPFGSIRLKVGGGEGGHNGLKSMTQCLGSSAYSRVRIGIGRPGHAEHEVSDYVLSSFSAHEKRGLEDVLIRSQEAIDAFLDGSFPRLMNTFNRRENGS